MARSDPYELAYQIDRLMRRMNAGVVSRAPHFDKERVGPIGGMILLTIAEVEPAPMQQIADMMARNKAQLSRTIGSLERRGLVMRLANDADRRSTLLQLTPDGHDLVRRIKAALTEVLGEILAPLEADEHAALLTFLQKL